MTCGDAVKILSDGRYQSGPSHQLLPPLCGPSPEPPDPFDEHRDEPATTRRMAWATTRVKSLSGQGWKAHTARLRPAPSTRPGPAGCSPQRTAHQSGPWTGRGRPSPSPAPSPPTSRTVTPYPTEGNQNTWQTILAPDRLQRETETEKIAVVPDNARPPPRESVDRPPPAGSTAGAHHPCFPAAVRARPQPRRERPEHGQEQHREHSARDPRRNPRRVRLTRHRTHRRPRLRAPPTPRNQKRSCSMTAIEPNHYSFHLLSQSAPSWTCEQRTTTTTTKLLPLLPLRVVFA
ncbi:hypothetical protein HMPREF0682_1657 [Propionibacterium acidifaciens F0233]|uniref:Uncharacterized protein n=1 Tax=Propionibacterium acidifaciens F0233 TaxID=553198 RepID=U2PEV9_9ACTN|nr:hypothetical protein HMPREF0682_1657 [Propionibacterium acidifaciens F0233]